MSQDIRKWFAKKPDQGTGNGNAAKTAKPGIPEKPSGATLIPHTGKMAQGVQECSSRRKTSKYFDKDKQNENAKDEMEIDEVPVKTNSSATKKRILKLEDDDEDFVTPTSKKGSAVATPSKKLKSSSGKAIARKLEDESDDDDVGKVKSSAKSAGKGRGAKGTSAVPTAADIDDEEDVDNKDVKPAKSAGRGRGGRGASAAPAGGRGRGAGRGGFTFGERKDPPHKGEKEVPEGAADCLSGLTFVISGTLDSLEREEAEDLIKRHGGRVTGSVSKKTNFLLCDEDIGGRKSEKAKELGTGFLTEDGLFDMIRASNKSKTPVKTVNKSETMVAPSPPKKTPPKSERTNQAGQVSASKDIKGVAIAAASSRQKDHPSDKTWLPWAEKYRPGTPNDLVGNQSLVKQLHDWLVNWNGQFLNTGSKGKKQNDSAKKAVLLSGTPGIGKTTTAKVVCKMLGYQAVEVNASDSRGKSNANIEKGIGGSTSNSVKELISNQALSSKMGSSQRPKTVLIMDEVDGMSGGDRGGVADLIASIKSSKVPIICICNDRYCQKLKSLINHCLPLNFRKPTKQQMAKRLAQIARAEGVQVNEIALEELAERVNGDMRMALNQLQYMSLSMSVINFDDVKQRLQKSGKDEDISPFTAVDKLLGFNGGRLRMDERIDLSMSDSDLIPLLIQENYINYRPSSAGKDDDGMKRMNLIARAAESIGDGDIINRQIRRSQQWQLSPAGTLASSIIPAALMHGQREIFEQGERNFNRFGGWLGKNSTMGKNYRLLEDMHVHFLASRESNMGRSTLRLEYVTLILKHLIDPLRMLPKDEAAEKVVKFMDFYSINMEDFNTIVDMSTFKGHPKLLEDIPSAVKSALTKAYNKGSSSRVVKTADLITLPGGIKKAPKKRVQAMLEPVEEENANELAEDEDENPSDADDEDEQIDVETKLKSDLQNLNSKGIQVQLDLKGSGSSSGKKTTPSGRGRGAAGGTSDAKGGRGRGSGSASKRKR